MNSPQPIPDGLICLDLKQVMMATGFSRTTVWRLEAAGRLRATPDVLPKRYSRKVVEAFLAGEGPGKGSK
jgi:hypothetical protein